MKKVSKILISLASLGLAVSIPSSLVLKNTSNSISKLVSSSHDAAVSEGDSPTTPSTTNEYTPYSPQKDQKINILDLQSKGIYQGEAYDVDSTGYATFTSSASASDGDDGRVAQTPDQITKFLTNNFYSPITDEQTRETTKAPKYAGSVDWSIPSSKLLELVKNLSGTSGAPGVYSGSENLELKSMLFSVGGYETYKSLFVLGEVKGGDSTSNSINGTYLFQIQWEDQIIGGKSLKAGSYRIAAKLSNDKKYNFLGLETPSTNTLQAIYVPEITAQNNNVQKSTIDYISVSNTNFEQKPTTAPVNGKTGSFEIATEQITTNFGSSGTFKPIYLNRINSAFFIVYYDDNKKIVMAKTPILNDNVSDKNVKSFTSPAKLNELTSTPEQEQSASPTNKIKTSILYDEYSGQTNKNFDFVFTVKNSKKSIHYSLDYTNFKGTEKVNEDQDVLTSPYLKIVKKYDLGSTVNNGYLGLTEDDKVLVLDKDFNATSILYDFTKSTIDLGKIYSIYTKVSDGNWYAQMTDGTFAVFSNNTLIGQWDKVSSKESYELPVRFKVKSENEISSSILFKKVASDDQQNYDPTFLQYLNNTDTYKDFLDIDQSSIDPRLNGAMPSIKVSILKSGGSEDTEPTPSFSSEEKESKKYKVTLVFTQTLRQISSTGEVKPDTDNSARPVEIARQTYTFNNAKSSVTANNDKNAENFSIPSYVLNMYPSEIIDTLKKSMSSEATNENKNFINYFLNLENISGATYSFTGNDLNGTLSITINVPLMWQEDSGDSLKLVENYSETFTFGSEGEPFFAYNPFGKDSNGNFNDSITPIDKAFESDKQNASKIESLKGTYSTKLPSSLSKQEYLKNFLILGPAFNQQNIDQFLIQMPEDDNINVVPDDVNGTAFVDVTFPMIGGKTNYRVSFQTAQVFAKNQSASQTVYFSWKNKDNIQLANGSSSADTLATQNDFATYKASEVAKMINAAAASVGSGAQSLLQVLSKFADFSSYYANLITNQKIVVSATYNDKYGLLNINLAIKDGVEIPGISSSNISISYGGFNTDGTSEDSSDGNINLAQDFRFGQYTVSNEKTPSSITENELIGTLLPAQAEWDKLKKNNDAKLTLTPSNSTGILQVSVTLKNYVTGTTVLPSKTFTTTLTGFKVSTQQNNLISWKSNNDLGIDDYPSKVKSSVLSNAGSNLNKEYNLRVLEQVAFISSELKEQLDSNPTLVSNVTLIDNNTDGTLAVTATIKINGQNQVFSTVVNGLKGTEYSYSAKFNENVADVNSALAKLRTQLPSSIKADDPNLQNLLNLTSSKNLVKQVILTADDFTGTLQIDVKVIDPDNNNKVLEQNTKTFDGFIKQVYADAGTNWLAVALSIIIPVVVLTIPIISFGYIQNRRDMKKIGKRLSTRLSEERERAKRREKLGLVGKKISI